MSYEFWQTIICRCATKSWVSICNEWFYPTTGSSQKRYKNDLFEIHGRWLGWICCLSRSRENQRIISILIRKNVKYFESGMQCSLFILYQERRNSFIILYCFHQEERRKIDFTEISFPFFCFVFVSFLIFFCFCFVLSISLLFSEQESRNTAMRSAERVIGLWRRNPMANQYRSNRTHFLQGMILTRNLNVLLF